MNFTMELDLNTNIADFPVLECATSSHMTSYFREQLIYFQFNLTRKHNSDVLEPLYTQFVQVLQSIKKCMHENENKQEYIQILDAFYCLLFYTRDMHEGKGERTLSYLLIMAFYDVYPVLAIYAVHEFVRNSHKSADMEPHEPISSPAIGSWKDMIAICDFLRDHSNHGDKHPLIDTCIEMAVLQLIKDNKTWKFSIRAMNPHYISNIAKWIPREHKKYDWMFDRFATCWAKKVYPHILNSAITPESREKAATKCKQLFRKQISYLNKKLQTPEIRMTQNNWDAVDPLHIPVGTYMKHFDKLNAVVHRADVYSDPPCITGSFPTFGFLINQAVRILADCHGDGIGGSDDDSSGTGGRAGAGSRARDQLNAQWRRCMNQFQPGAFQFTIPILDVSSAMQQTDPEAFYNAIGLAMTIACKSSLECRIIAIASNPVWIQWERTDTFMDIIENLFDAIMSIRSSPLQYSQSIDLIMQGIRGSHSTPRFIENMNIVVISDFSTNIQKVDVSTLFTSNMFTAVPTMFFWNISTQGVVEPFTTAAQYPHYFYSGTSIHALRDLQTVVEAGRIPIYDAVVAALEKPRYLAASAYLHSLCSSVGE
jgi:hypothetical protein